MVDIPAICSLEVFLEQDFDFIIIGGGTAGLAVAARLSENPSINVGVLEAGLAHISDPLISCPGLHGQTIGNPKYDWQHKTIPQTNHNNLIYELARGKGLGGTSNINYQMYSRGHVQDYADWENLGMKGWSFEDLLPYFKKSESFDDPKEYQSQLNMPLKTKFDVENHGTDGPIHTSFTTWQMPVEEPFAASSIAIGLSPPAAPWSGDHLGGYSTLSTIDRSQGPNNATRCTSVTGYLLPNAHRPNLKVLVEALVSKIEVSETGVISGVHFLHSSNTHFINVKKEVVLSAGAMKSPQILELSGIGNPTILSSAGVKCLVPNTRVGENYQDHIISIQCFQLTPGHQTLDRFQDPSVIQKEMSEYMTSKTGLFSSTLSISSTNIFASYASLSTSSEVAAIQKMIVSPKYAGHSSSVKQILANDIADSKSANIQIFLIPASINPDGVGSMSKARIPPQEQLGKHGISIVAGVQRGHSVGSTHITSSDPLIDSLLDPNFLSHPADLEVLAKGMEYINKLTTTSPLKECIEKRYSPAPEIDFGRKEEVERYLRGHTATSYHPIGTVGMGREGEGAVDERLRVWGCSGLRVVDASVIPLHVSGNIVGTVYAIAEKGADMIKADWGL